MSERELDAPPEAPAAPHPRRLSLRRILITGLVTLAPVALTVFVLILLFRFAAGLFAPLIGRAVGERLPEFLVPALGLLATLLVVLLLGWLSTNVVGRRVIHYLEQLIARIPIAKSVYSATKGVLVAVAHSQTEALKTVVLVEYPKRDVYSIGFVTGAAQWPAVDARTGDMLLVFVPTTPNPTNGFLLLVPRSDAIELSLSVEDGVRLVVSGGILVPPPPARVPVAPRVPVERLG